MAELFNEDLDEADNAEVIRKLLDTLKSALMEERQMELALRASEALLQFNPEDPYEIRDRGLIYAQLDCDHVALLDLSYFVEQRVSALKCHSFVFFCSKKEYTLES